MRHWTVLSIEVICLVCILYTAAAVRSPDVSREVYNVLRDLNPADEQKLSSISKYCQCVKYKCGCCARFNLKDLKIVNTTGCVNVSYLPDQFGFNLVLTLNHTVLYNTTVSAKNPPPICVAVPYLEQELSLCVDLYNLDVNDTYVSGCVKLEAHVLHVTVMKLDLGCFQIPLPSVSARHTAAAVVKAMKAARSKNSIFY